MTYHLARKIKYLPLSPCNITGLKRSTGWQVISQRCSTFSVKPHQQRVVSTFDTDAWNSCHLGTCSFPWNNNAIHQVTTISLDHYQCHLEEPTSALTKVVPCGAKLITWPSTRTIPWLQWESGSCCTEVTWLTCSDSNAFILWQQD